MLNICLIIMLVTNLFKENTGQSRFDKYPCQSFENIDDQNTPIKAEKIKLWEKCLQEYNTSRIHTIEEIYLYLRIASRSPYGHIKLQNLTLVDVRARNIAITTKGNYIPYVNISTGSYVRKPAIVIVGGMYARDWLTIAASVFVVEELVLNYKNNYNILSKTAWIIVPVLNPDGYAETMLDGSNRNWIKNMKKFNSTRRKCSGVNLYKNFEYQWINYNYKNVSNCSDIFSLKPFSEIESRSLKDTIASNLDAIKMFVSLIQRERGYSYPFAFTDIKPLNYTVFDNILKRSTQAAQRLYHRTFDYGHILKFEKKSAGGPSDWIKAHFQVEMAFTCGISYFQNNHYILSTTEINKTNQETFAALKTIASLGTDYAEDKFTF